MAATRTSRVFTISFPPELAERAEGLAKEEGRTISELFREAFRTYYAESQRAEWQKIAAYAAAHNPHGYTEEDVPGLIKVSRADRRAELPAIEGAQFASPIGK